MKKEEEEDQEDQEEEEMVHFKPHIERERKR
jgi:hypothetical protein